MRKLLMHMRVIYFQSNISAAAWLTAAYSLLSRNIAVKNTLPLPDNHCHYYSGLWITADNRDFVLIIRCLFYF